MPDASPLLLIQLTPPGRGAVASLRVEGNGVMDLIARHFVARNRRLLADYPPGRIVVGRFVVQASRLPDVVQASCPPDAAQTAAPPSDGEEVVLNRPSDSAIEIHCHGGSAAVARIEEILAEGGCRRISWQEWTLRQEADPIAAAARMALAEARTERTAAILLDQHHGALRRAIERIESALRAGGKDTARQQIEAILAHAATGLHLVRPWQVVVAGPPNVGKSSLMNAIAGYQRAIVHSAPGTTRDIVSVQTAMDGWPVEISDTAGLRETDEEIERAGIDLARKSILAADQVILVFDNALPWSGAEQALVDSCPKALRVDNKCDLPAGPGHRPPGIEVSAIHATGIDALCHEIAGHLVPHPPSPGTAVPFTPEQIEQIRGLESRL